MHSSHQWPQLVVCSSIQGKALRKCIQAPMYTHVQERTVCVLSMFVLCSIIKPPLINATATTPLHPASSSAAADRAQNYQVASNPVKGEQYYQFHLQERREFGEGSWKMEMDGHCIAFSDRSHSFLPVPMICVMSLDRCIYFPLPTFLLGNGGLLHPVCRGLPAEGYQQRRRSPQTAELFYDYYDPGPMLQQPPHFIQSPPMLQLPPYFIHPLSMTTTIPFHPAFSNAITTPLHPPSSNACYSHRPTSSTLI